MHNDTVDGQYNCCFISNLNSNNFVSITKGIIKNTDYYRRTLNVVKDYNMKSR